MSYKDIIDPSILVGCVINRAEQGEGDVLVRIYSGAHVFNIVHRQDCCESVSVFSLDLSPIIGKKLSKVEGSTDNELPPGYERGSLESWTNSYFTFTAEDGSVGQIYIFGESNGFYSESVDFEIEGKNAAL